MNELTSRGEAFAEHECDILDVEPGQGRSLITGERYPTFALKSESTDAILIFALH